MLNVEVIASTPDHLALSTASDAVKGRIKARVLAEKRPWPIPCRNVTYAKFVAGK